MKLNRRSFLKSSPVCLASSAVAATAVDATSDSAVRALPSMERAATPADFKIGGKNLRHSVMGWCFQPMPAAELATHCVAMGIQGIEGIDRKQYPVVRDLGLEISLVGSHGFAEGPCNPAFREVSVAKLTEGIELAAEVGARKVITFTGMRFPGMDEQEAVRGCLETWKKVLPLAEAKGVTLVLEHLNSRDDSHPMKGHPGYFGDDVDFCLDLVKKIDNPHFKLLFDIYHVSVMNGDVIRRIRANHEWIGHYHTAGNPGRGELDDSQEIYYPAIIQAIVETGYRDFIAHEFIPTWNEPVLALRHACRVCDI